MSGVVVISDEQLRAVERIRRRYVGSPTRADGSPTGQTRVMISAELQEAGLELREITVVGWGQLGPRWHIDVGVPIRERG